MDEGLVGFQVCRMEADRALCCFMGVGGHFKTCVVKKKTTKKTNLCSWWQILSQGLGALSPEILT